MIFYIILGLVVFVLAIVYIISLVTPIKRSFFFRNIEKYQLLFSSVLCALSILQIVSDIVLLPKLHYFIALHSFNALVYGYICFLDYHGQKKEKNFPDEEQKVSNDEEKIIK